MLSKIHSLLSRASSNIKRIPFNMEEKMEDTDFTKDIHVILRPEIEYDNHNAHEFIKKELLENL